MSAAMVKGQLHVMVDDLGCAATLCDCPADAWITHAAADLADEIVVSLERHAAFDRYLAADED